MLPFFKQGPGTDSVVFAILAHPASLTRMEISGQILPNSTGELPGNPYIMGILRTAKRCFYLRKHHRHWFPKIGISKSTLTPHLTLQSFYSLILPLECLWNLDFPFHFHCQCPSLGLGYLLPGTSQQPPLSISSTNLYFIPGYTPYHSWVITSEHYHGAPWCLFS